MAWVAVLLLMSSTAAGVAPDADETIRVLSLGDAPIVVFELVIRADGARPSETFAAAVDRLFQHADRNHDGQTTSEEARGAIVTPTELRLFSGTSPQTTSGPAGELPRDGFRKTSDLQTYLRRIGMTSVGFDLRPRAANPDQRATSGPAALFERLDTSGDGKLAPEELAKAFDVLRKLDRDDDETLSLVELQSLTATEANRPAMANAAAATLPFVSPASGESVVRMTRRIMDKYDTAPRDQKLSPTELKLPPQDFPTFDVDGDGQLDQAELRLVLTDLPARLTLHIDIGTGEVRAEGELAAALHVSSDGARHLPLGKSEIRFACQPGEMMESASIAKGLLQVLDRNSNGYLEPAELPVESGLGIPFASVDADQNQKVFAEELAAALQSRLDLARSRTVITIAEQGGTLFEILDADRDGRLARREVREVGKALTLWDKDGDGFLAADEIPLQYAVTVARGTLNLPIASRPAVDGTTAPGAERPGPRWFVRMDRNRDGEVSRREFLAELSLFERLDRNRDGAIDGDEALQAVR